MTNHGMHTLNSLALELHGHIQSDSYIAANIIPAIGLNIPNRSECIIGVHEHSKWSHSHVGHKNP